MKKIILSLFVLFLIHSTAFANEFSELKQTGWGKTTWGMDIKTIQESYKQFNPTLTPKPKDLIQDRYIGLKINNFNFGNHKTEVRFWFNKNTNKLNQITIELESKDNFNKMTAYSDFYMLFISKLGVAQFNESESERKMHIKEQAYETEGNYMGISAMDLPEGTLFELIFIEDKTQSTNLKAKKK